MSSNIYKIILNHEKSVKFLSFKKLEDNILQIKGFFGKAILTIPSNIILEIDEKSIILFFSFKKLKNLELLLKSLYHNIIFSSYGLVFNHYVNMQIKGIGHKFELKPKDIVVFNGNSLPTVFDIPGGFKILDNSSFNNFIVFGGNYSLLNNFVNKIRSIAVPNKYKEIGIFLKKGL